MNISTRTNQTGHQQVYTFGRPEPAAAARARPFAASIGKQEDIEIEDGDLTLPRPQYPSSPFEFARLEALPASYRHASTQPAAALRNTTTAGGMRA